MAVSAVDAVGNGIIHKTAIPVDILVMREGDRLRIIISSIYFKPNTADYLNVDPEVVEKNLDTLDKLAVILKKFSDYKILLEGHAVRVYWNNPDRWLTEENEVLLPLSEDRAEAIKAALVRRSVEAARMSTQGRGATSRWFPTAILPIAGKAGVWNSFW